MHVKGRLSKMPKFKAGRMEFKEGFANIGEGEREGEANERESCVVLFRKKSNVLQIESEEDKKCEEEIMRHGGRREVPRVFMKDEVSGTRNDVLKGECCKTETSDGHYAQGQVTSKG